MRKPNNKLLTPKSEREELFDAILGPDEEMDEELADEILATYGIAGADLVEEFALRLQAELRKHYAETHEVSEPLSAALKSIREQQRAAEPVPVRPGSWIARFLGGTPPQDAQCQPQVSFHNLQKDVVSMNDKEILDELENELNQTETE